MNTPASTVEESGQSDKPASERFRLSRVLSAVRRPRTGRFLVSMKALFNAMLLILLLITVKGAAQEPNVERTFPKIKTHYGAGGLDSIAAYCEDKGIGQAKPNTLRYFHQPLGDVDRAIEVNLNSGRTIIYPSGYDKDGQKIVQQLACPKLTALKAVLRSRRFADLPLENPVFGDDGYSILIESTLDRHYVWKLHWSPDGNFLKVSKEIEAILNSSSAGQGIDTDTPSTPSSRSPSRQRRHGRFAMPHIPVFRATSGLQHAN